MSAYGPTPSPLSADVLYEWSQREEERGVPLLLQGIRCLAQNQPLSDQENQSNDQEAYLKSRSAIEVEELVVLDLVTGYGGCEEDLMLLLHALLKYICTN